MDDHCDSSYCSGAVEAYKQFRIRVAVRIPLVDRNDTFDSDLSYSQSFPSAKVHEEGADQALLPDSAAGAVCIRRDSISDRQACS